MPPRQPDLAAASRWQHALPPGPFTGLLALAVLLLCAGLGLRGTALDVDLFHLGNAWGPPAATLWSALSVAGLGASALLLAGACGPRHPQVLVAMLLGIVLGGLAVHLCKAAFDAARPLAVLGAGQLNVIGVGLSSHAMPSGHSAMGGFAAGLLATWRPARGRWLYAAAALAVGVMVALARVAVGAHWPSDTLAGTGLGLGTAVLLVGSARGRRWLATGGARLSGRVASHAVAAALVVAAAMMWVGPRDYPLAGWAHGLIALAALAGAAGWWRSHPGPRTLQRQRQRGPQRQPGSPDRSPAAP